MERNIIIILGMHRSGTSLIASWLQNCGINIGENLLSGGTGNIKGHFEDLDFLNFHEGILKKNNTDYLNIVPSNIKIEAIDFHLVNSIIGYKLQKCDVIAWKDPRTCIFINSIWLKTSYDKKIIFIYRPFEEIIRSLYERKINSLYSDMGRYLISSAILKFFKTKLFILKYRKAIIVEYCKMYINYMEEVLIAFEKIDKEDLLFVDITKIKENQFKILNHIKNKWKIPVSLTNIDSVFSKTLFKKDKINLSNIDINIYNKCKTIDKKLKAINSNQ